MNSYFVIVGTLDNPLYELESGKDTKTDHRHLNQFIVHSSLDIVEELMHNQNQMYLKVVDKFNEFNVSAYVSPSGIKLMLLHDQLNSDSIKNFFVEANELYIKLLLNPFYNINSAITSINFDNKIKGLARKYL